MPKIIFLDGNDQSIGHIETDMFEHIRDWAKDKPVVLCLAEIDVMESATGQLYARIESIDEFNDHEERNSER